MIVYFYENVVIGINFLRHLNQIKPMEKYAILLVLINTNDMSTIEHYVIYYIILGNATHRITENPESVTVHIHERWL